ncbi:hypothetical protein M2407_005105 [Serratia sp. BIGb0234]|nr:hypothetical protein [Serratia sp. BIGb0234]
MKVLQALLGHEKPESTEVYTKVFALDMVASHQVQFTLPAQDSLEMVRAARALVAKN